MKARRSRRAFFYAAQIKKQGGTLGGGFWEADRDAPVRRLSLDGSLWVLDHAALELGEDRLTNREIVVLEHDLTSHAFGNVDHDWRLEVGCHLRRIFWNRDDRKRTNAGRCFELEALEVMLGQIQLIVRGEQLGLKNRKRDLRNFAALEPGKNLIGWVVDKNKATKIRKSKNPLWEKDQILFRTLNDSESRSLNLYGRHLRPPHYFSAVRCRAKMPDIQLTPRTLISVNGLDHRPEKSNPTLKLKRSDLIFP